MDGWIEGRVGGWMDVGIWRVEDRCLDERIIG